MKPQTFSVRPSSLYSMLTAFFGLPLLALLCPASSHSPAEPNIVRSEAGHFIVRIMGVDRPERLNRMHGLDVSLTTSGGRPVSGATLLLTGQRRYTSNPLPTQPKVSASPGEGHYRVEGLRFHMPGEWRLVFDIEFAQYRDRATLEVVVK